ncbi:hypothetical protein D3C76_1088990 [compost metagenome]
MGHIAELSAGARPTKTSRPLLNVSSKRGLAPSCNLPAALKALRKGASNLRQKVESSLPSLVSSTSSQTLPNAGKSAKCSSKTLMRSVSGSWMNAPRAHCRGKIRSTKRN